MIVYLLLQNVRNLCVGINVQRASALKFRCPISKRATGWDWDTHFISLFAKEIDEKTGEISADYSI
jgi:hypothetical protein